MMRLLQVILVVLLAGFALLAGIMLAALVALAGLVFLLVQLLGGRRSAALPGTPATDRGAHSTHRTDVIEISATEVTRDLPNLTAPSEGGDAPEPPSRPAPPGNP